MSELCCAAWLAWLGLKMCVVETGVVPGLVAQQKSDPRQWFGAFRRERRGIGKGDEVWMAQTEAPCVVWGRTDI